MGPIPKLIGIRAFAALALSAAAAGMAAAATDAAPAPGGLGAPERVTIADVTCVSRCVDTRKATPGATVRVRGLAMERVSAVVFRGSAGPLRVAPVRRGEMSTIARVPKGARSGRPYVVDTAGQKSRRSPRKLYVLPARAIPVAVFPVRGPHSFWDGFGAGRGHQGADVGAACGTPLVAALAGRVTHRARHSRAGHYLVIDVEAANAEIAYMHLPRPAPVSRGQKVHAGQLVGHVGETGRATGCHLHFEYWIGRWWRGGTPVDPTPYLREWRRQGRAAKRG